MRTITVSMAAAVVALAPVAHADVYAGPYDVSDCALTWGPPGHEFRATVSSQDCVDGFLYLMHNEHIVSSPDPVGPPRTSDSQLTDNGEVACYYYRKEGYGIDRTAAMVRRLHNLSGGKSGDPAAELVSFAIISLCEVGGLREYVPGN